jgi:hypothetical protein
MPNANPETTVRPRANPKNGICAAASQIPPKSTSKKPTSAMRTPACRVSPSTVTTCKSLFGSARVVYCSGVIPELNVSLSGCRLVRV